ncbi:MAG TPA: zinc ribbon domain-containing protein [Aggregatilineales bacterium]|nr:zinc ribbon domain-containing protein [Aggregatilineales bacterium]
MHIAQNWRLNGQRYSLKGARCQHCDKVIFPARDVCPYCQQQTVKESTEPIAIATIVLERAAR